MCVGERPLLLFFWEGDGRELVVWPFLVAMGGWDL